MDDIEVTAATVTGPACPAPEPHPFPDGRPPWPGPRPWPGPDAGPPRPAATRPALTALTLTPEAFVAARRGPAVARRGRAGATLRFRLSEPATVRFRITPGGQRLTFRVRGRRGLNRLRFSGRVRGRRLPAADYSLTAVATGRSGLDSAPAAVRFRIEDGDD